MAKGPSSAAGSRAVAVSVRALQLLGRWNRVARGHIALGGGCGCGFGGAVSVTVADFEPQVLDFLRGRFAAGSASFAELFEAIGHRDGEGGSIEALLGALAKSRKAPSGAAAMLEQLESSIDSFEAAHGGRRI